MHDFKRQVLREQTPKSQSLESLHLTNIMLLLLEGPLSFMNLKTREQE